MYKYVKYNSWSQGDIKFQIEQSIVKYLSVSTDAPYELKNTEQFKKFYW